MLASKNNRNYPHLTTTQKLDIYYPYYSPGQSKDLLTYATSQKRHTLLPRARHHTIPSMASSYPHIRTHTKPTMSSSSASSSYSCLESGSWYYVISDVRTLDNQEVDLSSHFWQFPTIIDDVDITFDGTPLCDLYEEDRRRFSSTSSSSEEDEEETRGRQRVSAVAPARYAGQN